MVDPFENIWPDDGTAMEIFCNPEPEPAPE
jgi:hypothetical protein